MSFIKTKLSVDDKVILGVIYNELENITLPTTYQSYGGQGHQIRTGSVKQKDARQSLFGCRKYNGRIEKTKYYKNFPHIMDLFKRFIFLHYPSFEFDSVYINRNVVCKKHLDSRNVGESLLVGLGKYTGGQTCLYINDKEKKFHIKSNSLLFNGSEIEHKSMPFNGTRYSLVFFKT